MITTDPEHFLSAWRRLPVQSWGSDTARAALLMAPDGLSAAATTCADNRYMDPAAGIDADRAQAQHRALAAALTNDVPLAVLPGDPSTPDATFLNNAFATIPGRLILGAMRYPERQRETGRTDVVRWFTDRLGYTVVDLAGHGFVAELTGSLVIDRRRGVGFCGLGERCDLSGAQAMHDAFGLRLTYAFDLAPGEYHTNVVMSVLAGRALVLCPQGLADAEAAEALSAAYGKNCIGLSLSEKNAFAGNCIALGSTRVWMSAAACAGLHPATRSRLAEHGWTIGSVDLSEIEKAGGSLRCCVAEVF